MLSIKAEMFSDHLLGTQAPQGIFLGRKVTTERIFHCAESHTFNYMISSSSNTEIPVFEDIYMYFPLGPRASSISAAQGTASNGPAASPEAFAHSGLLATSKRSSNAMGRPLPITPESTQAWASMLACRARFSSKSMTIGAPIAKTAPSAPLYSPLTSGLYEHSSSSASAGNYRKT